MKPSYPGPLAPPWIRYFDDPKGTVDDLYQCICDLAWPIVRGRCGGRSVADQESIVQEAVARAWELLTGVHITTEFTVNVHKPDDNRASGNLLATLSTNGNAPDTVLDLSNSFASFEHPEGCESRELRILKNEDPSLVSATLDHERLRLSYLKNQDGKTTVTIQEGDSLGRKIAVSYSVTVAETYARATSAGAVPNVSARANASSMAFDLTNTFASIAPRGKLILSILGNSAPDVVRTTLIERRLALDYQEACDEPAMIVLEACQRRPEIKCFPAYVRTIVNNLINAYYRRTQRTPRPIDDELLENELMSSGVAGDYATLDCELRDVLKEELLSMRRAEQAAGDNRPKSYVFVVHMQGHASADLAKRFHRGVRTIEDWIREVRYKLLERLNARLGILSDFVETARKRGEGSLEEGLRGHRWTTDHELVDLSLVDDIIKILDGSKFA